MPFEILLVRTFAIPIMKLAWHLSLSSVLSSSSIDLLWQRVLTFYECVNIPYINMQHTNYILTQVYYKKEIKYHQSLIGKSNNEIQAQNIFLASKYLSAFTLKMQLLLNTI